MDTTAQAEHVPTVEEGRDMFLTNPGLSAVVTTAGVLTRDGLVDGQPYSEALAEGVALAIPLSEELPSVAEARAMFAETAGLASVVTEQGTLSRDGALKQPAW